MDSFEQKVMEGRKGQTGWVGEGKAGENCSSWKVKKEHERGVDTSR